MKALFYGETPCIQTGASLVDKHLLDVMVALGWDLEVIAMSHMDEYEYDRVRFPYPITGVTSHEQAGKLIDEKKEGVDLIFISADMHVPNILYDHWKDIPKSVILGAIDCNVYHPKQIPAFSLCTIPAVYSQAAHAECLKVVPELQGKLLCTQLGCEPETFFPLSTEERREYRKRVFGIGDETFLAGNFNRNQRRKDLARSMKAFGLFHARMPASRLYMHAAMQDQGGDITTQAFFMGLDPWKLDNPTVMFAPPDFSVPFGFDREKLNKLYNACDVIISTAQGEGWGLTTTEAMAAGTPFIGPDNTSFIEILGADCERGYLVPSGGNNLWDIAYGQDDAPRPITNVTHLAETLYHVYKNPEQAQEKAWRARAWTLEHPWSLFKEQWKEVLCQIESMRLLLV
jgi:glycosyltransferase involved in cell wall biosynthesis